MAKLKVKTDPHNRLVIKESGKKTPLPRFRYVVDGRFKTGKDNTLLYHVKAPLQALSDGRTLPHQLKFKGNWSLTKDHNLKLTLNKWRRQTIGDEITLHGKVIRADADSLLFGVTQRTQSGKRSIYTLRLAGTWQADKSNRITFRAKKKREKSDLLVFDGIWEVNRRHRIVYTYQRRAAAKKRRRDAVEFRGYWKIVKRNVLTYQMDYRGKAAFNFRVGTGIVRKNRIIFDVGIGLSKSMRPVRKSVVLYGTWRIVKGSWLLFEIKYGGGIVHAIKFSAIASIFGKNNIRFALRDEAGKDLGVTFTLSRRLLKNGETFVKFLRKKKEKAVYIGAGFIW